MVAAVSTLTRPWLIRAGFVLTPLLLSSVSWGATAGVEDPIDLTTDSILEREAPGTGLTYRDVNASRTVEEEPQPVILPLPAPLMGAAIGLIGVYAFKRKYSRA